MIDNTKTQQTFICTLESPYNGIKDDKYLDWNNHEKIYFQSGETITLRDINYLSSIWKCGACNAELVVFEQVGKTLAGIVSIERFYIEPIDPDNDDETL